MITRTVIRSGGGGGGLSIPSNITAMQGQIIGPPLGEIEIAAGDCLYLKVKRAEAGDGVISGPVSIDGNALSVAAAQVITGSLKEVGDTAILAVENRRDKTFIGYVPAVEKSLNQITATFARGVSIFDHNGSIWLAASLYTGGLAFFDISDINNVQHVITETDSGFFHGGAVKIGGRLFCPARESGLYIYDLTNLGASALGSPTILACPTAGITTATDPKVTGIKYDDETDILYIFDRVGGWGSIKDVSATASGSLAYSTTLRRITVSGTFNCETHRGDTLTVGSKRLLLVPSLTTNILVIEDVTDETTPVVQSYLLSTSTNYKCWDAKHLHGNYIVCSQWSYETNQRYRAGIAIFDLTDPLSPRLCSRWYDPAIPYLGLAADSPPLDIAVRDGVVYVAGGPTGVRVIDCGNPYHPVEITSYTDISRLSEDHGYASVCVFDGLVAAVGADIPISAGPVAVDIWTGYKYRSPHTAINFYPYGGKQHYIDDFFAESGPPNDGTKQWAVMYYPYSSAPAPEMSGGGKLTIPLPQNERAFGLLSPCKTMNEFHVKGRLSVDVLPPANGYIYISFATTRSIASGGSTIVFLQLIIQATADGAAYRAMVKYNNGSSLVNTAMTSASYLFSPETVYDFSIDWAASGISFAMGSAPVITVSGSFGAATRPKQVCIDANRVDTTSSTTFKFTLHDRLTINDSAIDWTHSDTTLWQSDTETERLQYGAAIPATEQPDIAQLAVDGDYCRLGGKTILKSTAPPYAIGCSIQPEHQIDFDTTLCYGGPVSAIGTLQPLTTESKFSLTRTVKSEGKPLTAGQIGKWVVGEVRYLTIPSGNYLELPSNE